MDVQVAESGPCRRTLTIKIPATQVKQHLDRMFKAAAHQVDLKGFRKGKIPRSVLERKFGPEIQREAKEQLVRNTVSEACREHELALVGRAEVEGLGEEPLSSDTDVEFQVHLDIRPAIGLKDVTGIEIKGESTDVTDDDMEKALADLAAQKRTLESVEDAVGETDFAKVDMTFTTEDGSEVSKREGQQINPGIPIAGTDPESFKSQLVGAEKGSTVTFELTFPDTFDKEEVRGQKGTVSVVVNEVLRVQDAKLDDEFAKSFEFDTLDALTAELRNRIGEQKILNEKNRQSEHLLGIVANDHPFELPENLVNDEAKHGLEQFKQRLEESGVAEEELEQKLQEAEQPAREEAERRVRLFFLIDAIARKEQISVADSDVEVELQKIAAHHKAPIEEVRTHYEADEAQSQLRLALLEHKVRDFLREKATITDS